MAVALPSVTLVTYHNTTWCQPEEAARPSETLVSYHIITWHHNLKMGGIVDLWNVGHYMVSKPEDGGIVVLYCCWHPTTTLHSVNQKMEATRFFESLVSCHIIACCQNQNMEAARPSEMLVSYHISTCYKLKMEAVWSSKITLLSYHIIMHNTLTWIFTALKTSNLSVVYFF
jgi:hypothetical protein